MGWLGWTLTVAGLLVGLVSLITLIGAFLPRDHVATRSLSLKQSPAEVFQILENAQAWPTWWKLLQSVESRADRDGKKAYRIVYQDGNTFDLVFSETMPPNRLITKIDDLYKMFEGTWTCEIAPNGAGCSIRLTENGSIPKPLIRAMAKMTMNPAKYIEINLNALAQHFGEPANIQP